MQAAIAENKEALEKMREAAEHHDDHHGPRCRRPRRLDVAHAVLCSPPAGLPRPQGPR